MAHQHGRSHIFRRQRNHQDDDEQKREQGGGVATVVSIKVVTMPNTFTGKVVWITQEPATLVAPPLQHSAPSNNNNNNNNDESTSKAASSRKTVITTDAARATTTLSPKVASTLMVASVSPTAQSASGLGAGLVSATASIATAAAASASSSAEADSTGMSGGAKAGLVLGILLAIGALLGAILFVYHRKKKQIADKPVDNEKLSIHSAPPPPPPQVETAPSINTQRTMSSAPRLSLRPVTQFSPTWSENSKNQSDTLRVAGALAPPRPADRTPSPDRPGSSWERLGAANAASPPTDPFSDPQPQPRPVSPPENPFGNNAAIDVPSSSAQASPSHSATPSADFANPAAAIAAAEAAPVAVALTTAAIPAARNQHSASSSIRSNTEMIPASPAWTEDLPASPGPAPTGPPPVAVAGGRTKGPAPASGPDNVHRVQLDFNPSMQDELELKSGQLVRMLHEYDDGWTLCIRMDRTQQGVVPRTCLSKHPVKPRTRSPPQGAPGPRARGPPINSAMGPSRIPQPRPLTPQSPSPRQMSPPDKRGPPTGRSRANSNAPYAGPPRSMSPGPYGGGPQNIAPPPEMSRPRSNSASEVTARRNSPPGPSPMNPNAPMPSRKPLPGQAL